MSSHSKLYSERWKKEGKIWKAILDVLQPIAEHVAKGWNADITHGRWDAPELSISWYTDDGIGRVIQVGIMGKGPVYDLQIGISAWKDDESLKERKWRLEQKIAELTLPSDPQQIQPDSFTDTLLSVYSTISSWAEEDLTERADLPLRPASSGRIIKGLYVR